MKVYEAYERVWEVIRELNNSGIEVRLKPSNSRNNKRTIEKYNKEGRLPPNKWQHVSFYCTTTEQSNLIFQKKKELTQLGIMFDTGAGAGARDWEIDWSFHVDESQEAIEQAHGRSAVVEDLTKDIEGDQNGKT